MNGRCHKDALDRAEDICELCGEQFCAAHLVYPRGSRKPPTCKDCALANSGLRGSSGPSQPISRREYKKRKKALLDRLEGVEEAAPTMEFFDADQSSSDGTTELDRRTPRIDAPEPIDILDRLDATATPPTTGKEDAPAAAPPPPAPPAAAPPPPSPLPSVPRAAEAPAPAGVPEAPAGFAPVDTSVNPLAIESEAAAGTPTEPRSAPKPDSAASAADLLARLKADQPIQSQFTSPSRPLDVDPFAPAPPPPAAVVPTMQPPPPTPDPISPMSDPFASDPTPPPAPTSDPFASKEVAQPPPRPKTEPWTPPTIPPRGSNLDSMVGNPPPEATTATPEASLPPIAPPPESEENEDRRSARAADTDTSGQWIPPSLRGIASPEERAADPLPRRR